MLTQVVCLCESCAGALWEGAQKYNNIYLITCAEKVVGRRAPELGLIRAAPSALPFSAVQIVTGVQTCQ